MYVCIDLNDYGRGGNCPGEYVLLETGGKLSGGICQGEVSGGSVRGNCPFP